jgi:hypothetical protein
MTFAYRLAGLKIESDLDFPDLMPWDGPATEPEIVFRLGNVPPRLEAADRVEAIFQTRGQAEYLLSLQGTGRIRVRDGRDVTIETEAAADPINTRALLTGPVQAMLWHQRGLLPLHANAVVVGDRAVALAGSSAAGKSALAAVLANDGHRILADDISVVDFAAGSRRVSVLPGVTLLRLWRDTLDVLGIASTGLRPALSGREKYFVDLGNVCRQPHELAAAVVLVRRTNVPLSIERLHGAAAMNALLDVVHMRRPARALGRHAGIFAGVTQVMAAGVTVWRLKLPDDPGCLRQAAAKVLSVLEPN